MTTKPRTQEESSDLIKRLDALTRDANKTTIINILDYKNQHKIHVGQKYGRYKSQFETFFSLMADYAYNINYQDKKHWPINRGIQFVIATRALKQLVTCHDLLEEGSYEDMLTVLRSAYESFLRVIFASLHPDCAENAVEYSGTGVSFNATNLVKQDLKLGWTQYSITSAFAHSNKLVVMEDLIKIGNKKQTQPIALDYVLNDDMIQLGINSINFVMTALLMAYDELFTVNFDGSAHANAAKSHVKKLHEVAQICLECLRTHDSNEYWRQSGTDLENIFVLMKKIDDDPTLKWKDEWAVITS